LVLNSFVVVVGPVLPTSRCCSSSSSAKGSCPAPRACEVYRAEEAAERRRAQSVDHAGLEVEEHRAWYVLAALGLVVKQVDAVEMRVVVAKVLAAAANAVLVAQNLL
jgi:hypothetical protein